MKNVLVLMHDDTGQEARFQTALDIIRAIDGHLICVDVAILPPFAADYADIDCSALLLSEEQERERANHKHMLERLRAEDVSYDWIDETGYLSPSVRAHAAMADLVVLNRELHAVQYPDMAELVGDVVVKTDKPIVAVPADARRFDAFGHVVIAWDGSNAAEAALRAAVPLLAHASQVTILEIDDGSLKLPSTAAAEYLSRHDIKASIRTVSSPSAAPAAIILDTVAKLGAAYLVMGGFGHSRFLEATFGGVTRHMLKECPVPLFMAH